MTKKNGYYDAGLSEPFRLSRSKIDLFCQCPKCFYLDRKLGVSQPSGAPFTLNNAVDSLLKKEFDAFRERREPHPFFKEAGVEVVPFAHPELENWRNNKIGIQYLHPSTNFLLFGAIDDVWQLASGELVIVDYKAKASKDDPNTFLTPKTKKNGDIVKTEKYKNSYKKQIEFYQWLFRKNGFQVSKTAYFVFANAQKDKELFDDHLVFEKILIPYEGDDSWVEHTIRAIASCLQSSALPETQGGCDFCSYRMKAQQVETASTIS